MWKTVCVQKCSITLGFTGVNTKIRDTIDQKKIVLRTIQSFYYSNATATVGMHATVLNANYDMEAPLP